ncbi:ATP-binding cassette domain-containing protein [Paenibacillus lautus]
MNVSFQLEKGYIMGFIGANGAGKTDAMKKLGGYSMETRQDQHIKKTGSLGLSVNHALGRSGIYGLKR